jgi:hypothetical protein
MSKLLLIHNSDLLFDTLKPPNQNRPLFYWYSDRFCSHQGTSKYLYIFAVDPVKDNVELRCRSGTRDFDSLHRDFLHYRDYCEGKVSEVKYSETGIAMSFSELTPIITLQARVYGSGKEEWLQTEFEIIRPHKPFTKRVISLFEAPYEELFAGKPIKFNKIPEIVDLIPDIDNVLPFKHIEPNQDGKYEIDNWLPMITHKDGTWL